MITFPSKDYLEVAYLTFDFSKKIFIDDIESWEFIVDRIKGEGPSSSLEFLAVSVGSYLVVAKVTGGFPYATYKIRCKVVSTNGDIFVEEGQLAISGFDSNTSITIDTIPPVA